VSIELGNCSRSQDGTIHAKKVLYGILLLGKITPQSGGNKYFFYRVKISYWGHFLV
jgi:hypothetical protein